MSSAVRAPLEEHCTICSGSLLPRPAVHLEGLRLFVCETCASWTALPRPPAAMQHAFHDSDTYFEHPYLALRRTRPELVNRRCAAIFGRIGRVLNLSDLRGERVMDVGCDTGEFILSAARQFGIRPVGIDVAHRAVEGAQAAGVETYQCCLEDARSHLKDLPVITAIDVIEHVADPRSFFRSLLARLRPGGVAYVETPNVDAAAYMIGRRLCGWMGGRPLATFTRLFPEEHIQYFSPNGLKRLAASCGLEIPFLQSRVLPLGEIAVGPMTRVALGAMQGLDYLTGNKLLHWAILRRPRD